MNRRGPQRRLPDGARRRARSAYGSRLLGPADQSARETRVRVQLLLTAMLISTNLVGAGLVFLISFIIIPAPEANAATRLAIAIAVPVYVAVAVLVGAVTGTTATLRALRWSREDESVPSAAQRAHVLKVPFRLTMIQSALWLGATVLFTLLSVVLQPARALTTGLTIGTATIVVSGIAYLLTELSLRPITARALTEIRSGDEPRGGGVRTRMVAFWLVGTGAPVGALFVGGVLALAGVSDLDRLAVASVVVSAVVLVFGLWVTILGARSVEAPVRSVRQAMRAVEDGQLDTEVIVYDGTELGLLQAGYNEMVAGLRDRERLNDLFGRHVGRQVAQMTVDGEVDVELGGATRVASVLFVDLTGSTSYAEEHGPAEVVEMLNRFFGVVFTAVDDHGGLVNKFMGDAVLALFGAPVEQPDHAAAALGAARQIAQRLTAEVTEVGFGVGVATGEVVVGHVGHEERFEYTAIGDAVNAAARITDLAKQVDGWVLATAEAVSAAGAEDAWVEHDRQVLRGRSAPTTIFALAEPSVVRRD